MKTLLLIIIIIIAETSIAQDSTVTQQQFEVQGYVKNLQIIDFNKNISPRWNSIIHNRINTKWKISEKYSATAEVRNRIFIGEDIRQYDDFGESLRNRNEYFNLQKIWIENNSLVFHSNIERLYFDYQTDKVSIRLGLQRINWGVTTTWNPNDIFNTYNFLDFDYEERPGSDGVKVAYKISNALNAEFAYANTGNDNGDIAALKFLFNKWNYDFQFISGLYKKELTLGVGWAGYIKSAGFKGEAQYFNQEGGPFNLSLEGDYMFKNGWYVNMGLLLNDHGLTDEVPNIEAVGFDVSPENLMPTKWTTIGTVAKEITPLLSVKTSIVYSPGTELLIFYPSLQYNIMPDFDLNFVLQSFFVEVDHDFENLGNSFFVRAQWSF